MIPFILGFFLGSTIVYLVARHKIVKQHRRTQGLLRQLNKLYINDIANYRKETK